MRLDQLLLQPVHRVLELVDARLELVGVSRARGQPRGGEGRLPPHESTGRNKARRVIIHPPRLAT